MLELIFNRPTNHLKVNQSGEQSPLFVFEASGDAWGNGGPNAPYGHDCSIAPGHYVLTRVEHIDPPIASEGAGQIYVSDVDAATVAALVRAGKAEQQDDGQATIAGITLPIGNLARYGRSEVMLHGGGSNLGVPACFADFQELCKTFGCTRLHNANLKTLMGLVSEALQNGQHVLFIVVGDSPALAR